jgi:hypothetical protein
VYAGVLYHESGSPDRVDPYVNEAVAKVEE